MTKLLDYQVPHVDKLVRGLNQYNVVVDASDTGTGKTFCALFTALKLGLKPFIVCPKCVISSWKRVAKSIGIDPIMVINYDQIIAPGIVSNTQQNSKLEILTDYLVKQANELSYDIPNFIKEDIVDVSKSKKKLINLQNLNHQS